MSDNTEVSYKDYYLNTILKQIQEDDFNGFKPVVGPTGMGKTSRIPPVIEKIREMEIGKSCIYTSHRHSLIEEMEKELADKNIPCVYLKSNEDVVRAFIKNEARDTFLGMLEDGGFFEDYAEISLRETKKLIRQIERLIQSLNSISSEETIATNLVREKLRGLCSKLLKVFKTGLSNMPLEKNEKLLTSRSLFWVLFPYAQFIHDPEKPVLLVTIHKLLYGFFTGHRDEGILSLEDKIIFLDEFDMQETEMLSFLCRNNEVRNSFEFVRLFVEEMRDQQQIGYLDSSSGETKAQQKAKSTIIKIVQDLEQECDDNKFGFPRISRFLLRKSEFKQETISAFQSNVLILTKPFHIRNNKIYWEIVKDKTKDTFNARNLFYTIFRTTEAILEFFTILWANDLTAEWRSWIEQSYDRKNDHEPGQYQKIIREYGVFKRPVNLPKKVKDENVQNSIYYKGYNFSRLSRGAYPASPDEVKIDQKTLTVSPEYILWRLCRSNLVFGLSATGDMKRYINSFDINWLEAHCNYLPVDENDKNIVLQLRQQKEAVRNYELELGEAKSLPKDHKLSRILDSLDMPSQFFTDDDESYKETAAEHRKKTVSRFLESLRWITQESNNQGHLIFLNSFKYIKKLFQKEHLSDHYYDHMQAQLRILPGEKAQEYWITIDEKDCYVILLDAKKGRALAEMPDENFVQKAQNIPLVVVTPYKTSSNGVNLKWVASEDSNQTRDMVTIGQDFEGIHLLEAPHYYFSDNQDDSDVDSQKVFIWQVWKLYSNHEISERQFIQALQDLNIARMNKAYKGTSDHLLNQIALFYQALGRVDRQWQPMPVMDIRLAQDVLGLFEKYLLEKGVIGKQRLDREPYTSSLILKLHEAINNRYLDNLIANQLDYEDIGRIEERSKISLRNLLQISSEVRKEAYSEEDARKIIQAWWFIREAVLKQDYKFKHQANISNESTNQPIRIDFEKDFVLTTAFLQNEHQLYIDWQHQQIVPHPTPNTSRYDLNKFYRNLEQNTVINKYFRNRNYKLRYHPSNQNYFFTRYVLQSVLAGAVGETALKAILEHLGISLEHELDCPPSLFEVFDMKVDGAPIYLDAKNFSWVTLHRFAAKPDEPDFDERLNSQTFLKAAQRKWQYIVEKTGRSDAKLVFINLISDDYRPNEGWDCQLNKIEPYSYAESAITIIQGVIRSDNLDELRDEFQTWINQVKEQLG
ncbi:MAG: hypothetical protein FOGNACKC_00749 [Anaerolineae bacterium]|nr:hypothetical protein [Anaerolineae bacterium]